MTTEERLVELAKATLQVAQRDMWFSSIWEARVEFACELAQAALAETPTAPPQSSLKKTIAELQQRVIELERLRLRPSIEYLVEEMASVWSRLDAIERRCPCSSPGRPLDNCDG